MPLLLIGIVLQWIYAPFQLFADGVVRFEFINQLIRIGKITTMKYSSIGPLFSYPLAFLDSNLGGHYWLLRYNFLLLCLAGILLYVLLKNLVSYRFLIIFLSVLFFASMFPGHIVHYYGEVFSALGMMLGILLIEKKKTLFGWVFIVASVGNVPATFIPLVFICTYKIIKEKNYAYFLLPILTLAVLLVDSKLRMPRTSQGFTNYLLDDKGFTTILPYSGKPGFSYPMFLGIMNELFSFGKGLLFFAPGLLLTPLVWKQMKETTTKRIYLLWLIYLVGLILTYSKWWAWYGGLFWGPRFLLFASIPASFNLAYVLTNSFSTIKTKIIALLLLFWSLWIGISGIVFGQAGFDICEKYNYALEHLCWYVPEFSVLFHPIVARLPINNFERILIFYSFCLGTYITITTILNKNNHIKK